jgi:hypothetical protein
MTQKAIANTVSPQLRAAAHVLAACKILRAMKTPMAKKIVEEIEPYISEIVEIKRCVHRGSL